MNFLFIDKCKSICQIDKDNSSTGVGTTTMVFAKTAHLAYPIAIVLLEALFSTGFKATTIGIQHNETFLLGIHFGHHNYNCKNDNDFKQMHK